MIKKGSAGNTADKKGSISEDEIVDILESISDAFFALDDNMVVTYFNHAAESYLQKDAGEVVGKPLFDAFPEARGSIFETRYSEALRTRRPTTFETYFDVPPYRNWYEVRVYPRKNGISVYFIVTTERKRTEEALRESEEKYRRIFENSVVGFFQSTPEGRFLSVNSAFAGMLGYASPEELVSCISDIATQYYVNPDDRLRYQQILQEQGYVENFEFRVRRKDNTAIWVSNSTRAYFDPHRKAVRYEGIVIDISDRKQAEEALRGSEEKYRQLFENAPIGIFRTDVQGKALMVNSTMARILDLDSAREAVVYYTDVERQLYIDAGRREEFLCLLQKNGFVEDFEYEAQTCSGRNIWLSMNARLSIDGQKGRQVIEGFSMDITDRKRAEKEKEQLEQQVRQAQKLESVGRLAGGVAHDLNNLLSPILGYGEMLLEETSRLDPRSEPLEEIVNAGKRARDLVRQLLAFSRKQTLAFRSVDLHSLLENFEKLLRRTIREDVAMHMNLAPSLPPVSGDLGQLEQVVMNLVVNAQDAMPHGGVLTIATDRVELDETVGAHHEDVTPGAYVMLTVSDTGSGMDAETQEHLFEPFFTTKEIDRGTGLGLATVYGIIKQHGGHIQVNSEPGRGTAFLVYLPVSAETAADGESALENVSVSRGSETILLVEDNEQVRNLTHVILKREGYSVLAAENGQAALAVLDRHEGPVHLLLSDVVMPQMNGKQLYETVSEAYPDMKVLYMSGYTDDVITFRGIADAEAHFIQKPFSVKALAAKVREVLEV